MTRNTIIFTPARIAELVTEPGKHVFEPTDEQKLIITAPQHTPLLIVAGAGSGKTETISQRVVWLVANGFVSPEEVLGLTFTRKAAGELSERIRTQLYRLRDALRESPELTDPATHETVNRVVNTLTDHISTAQVSTYNSFAGSLIAEFGELAGVQSDAAVIDDATAWRLARSVVNSSADARLIELEQSPGALTELVLKLNRSMRENLASAEAVTSFVGQFLRIADLPYKDGGDPEQQQPNVTAATNALGMLPLLLELAEEFAAQKRRRGLIEFSDQVALALTLVESSPAVRAALRERYPVVLLDEYQDTSVGQTRLLAALFAEHGVTAVGDPHQSIYGWRGASAANLAEYPAHFGVTLPELTLSTSWRNSERVLAAANALVEPLTRATPVEVKRLVPKPHAGEGRITANFSATVRDEATAVAKWLDNQRQSFFARHKRFPTCAVIMRQRALMPFFSEILTEHEVPNEIVGVGGLLSAPEVTDIISMLRCIWQIDAGSELIRLLAGPRWQIGVADLAALRDAATWLSRRDHALQKLSDDEQQAQRMHELPQTNVTIIEALDVLCSVADEHGLWQAISAVGRERMRDAGAVLTSLRTRTGQLSELVRQVEAELRLDIELVANETAHPGGGEKARANLDAFLDLVDNFIAIDDEGTLASFLAWLDRAVREDAVAEQTAEPNPNAVQLITVHGSKGLEWDYVVVPRLVTDEFPSQPKGLGGWLSPGELPFELRGDAQSQPDLAWRSVTSKMAFKGAESEFREAMRAHLAQEERRLIYVALTRARDELLLTGSFWSSQTKPRGPSIYLTELVDAGLISELPTVEKAPPKPEQREGATLEWPIDPLGSRAVRVRAAAAAVRDAQERVSVPSSERLIEKYPEIGLLLAERDKSRATLAPIAPERVNASSFKDFVTQPEAALQRLRRPMPEKPYRQAKIGTLFHQWVERRYATAGGTADELTADDFEWADDVAESGFADAELAVNDTLEALKTAFEASPWGDRRPIEIEREITVPFAGRRLVCKLDAVYENTDGSVEIVDWKTGKAPTNESEKELRLLQLELYRHAYATWKSLDPNIVKCSLFYVSSGEIVSATASVPLAELEARWLAVFDET